VSCKAALTIATRASVKAFKSAAVTLGDAGPAKGPCAWPMEGAAMTASAAIPAEIVLSIEASLEVCVDQM